MNPMFMKRPKKLLSRLNKSFEAAQVFWRLDKVAFLKLELELFN